MRKLAASLVLTLLVLIATAGVAEAKGGRTSTADCKAGSSDPDCPDEPDPSDTKNKPPPGHAAVGQAMLHRTLARSIVT